MTGTAPVDSRPATAGGVVTVEAPARLHLGLLDLRGDLGRRFGGLGAALRRPRVRVEARPAAAVSASGPDAARAERFAHRFLEHHGLGGGAAVRVHEAIPPHVGLGSGTQLALAVGRAVAEIHDIQEDVLELARAVGRTNRSGVGTWLFQRGGFVVDGGRKERGAPAPLLFHSPLPPAWRCVVAVPAVAEGVSGEKEAAAFRRLPAPPAGMVGEIARHTLMGALPALVEGDLPAFGAAITEIQRLVGDCFAPVQGGRFAHEKVAALVRVLREAGAEGVGQSSWGPAAFALAGEEEEAERLARVAEGEVGDGGSAFVTAFDNVGAVSSGG